MQSFALNHDGLQASKAPPARQPASKKSITQFGTILAQLPDNSTFYLSVDKVLLRAAELVTIPGVSPAYHLTEQILPAVQAQPGLVLNIAQELTWSDVLQLASRPFWRTPIQVTGEILWQKAKLSLMPSRGA